jgi:hypothetical protein
MVGTPGDDNSRALAAPAEEKAPLDDEAAEADPNKTLIIEASEQDYFAHEWRPFCEPWFDYLNCSLTSRPMVSLFVALTIEGLRRVRLEANRFALGRWRCHKLANGVEDNLELLIVALLQQVKLPG